MFISFLVTSRIFFFSEGAFVYPTEQRVLLLFDTMVLDGIVLILDARLSGTTTVTPLIHKGLPVTFPTSLSLRGSSLVLTTTCPLRSTGFFRVPSGLDLPCS